MGLLHWMTLAMFVLKLCGLITFSWWLVFLPSVIGAFINMLALLGKK